MMRVAGLVLYAALACAVVPVLGQETKPSVGKLRSSADEAFTKGEIDVAIKLMGQVRVNAWLVVCVGCCSSLACVLSPEWGSRDRLTFGGAPSLQVIALEPDNERNYYKRFRVYLRQRKYREAIGDLNKALAIKPTYTVCLQQRAKVLLMVGRCSEAMADYDTLLVRMVSHPIPH